MTEIDMPAAKIWEPGQHKETEEEKQARLRRNEILLAEPYEVKVKRARMRIRDWKYVCQDYGKTPAVSVGGLDSITLLALVRDTLGNHIDGISISTLEDKSIQIVHQEMGVIPIKPAKSKVQVLEEYGFPVISKMNASKIARLQTPDDDSPIVKAFMTGDMGAWGKFGHNEKFKLPDRWVELFGGLYGAFRPDLKCKCAPFKVSDQCCYWLKELPAMEYQQEHNIWPYLGLMQSEGGRRQYSLRQHGCNYVGKDTARSCPLNYFNDMPTINAVPKEALLNVVRYFWDRYVKPARWILVEEQLPETFRPVIVCRKGKDGSDRVEQGMLDVNGWWKVYGTRTKAVTHWMPPPDPPRAEVMMR